MSDFDLISVDATEPGDGVNGTIALPPRQLRPLARALWAAADAADARSGAS